MSEREGIVLPPLAPGDPSERGDAEGGEGGGEVVRVVRRSARVWAGNDEPAYVGAPPSPVASVGVAEPYRAEGRTDAPPSAQVWDDLAFFTPPTPAGDEALDPDPFADPPPPVRRRVVNVRARWIAGSVVVVLLGVLALAVRHRGVSRVPTQTSAAAAAAGASPAVAWRLPAAGEPVDAKADAPSVARGPLAEAGTVPTTSGASVPPASHAAPEGPVDAPVAAAAPSKPAAAPSVPVSAVPAPPVLAERRRLAGVPRTPPAWNAGDGLLVVTANQHAGVWIDGVDAGPVGAFVPVELPAGTYPVEVRTPAGVSRRVDVRVDVGSLRRVQVDLGPPPPASAATVGPSAPTVEAAPPTKAPPRKRARRRRRASRR
jgi:hypothetical protein